MSIQAGLYTYLAGISGLQALLGGTAPRIYPGKAPTTAGYPYVVYNRISSEHVHYQRAAAGLAYALFQIDVYDDDSPGAHAVAEQLRLALDGFTVQTWSGIEVQRTLLESERDSFESFDDGTQEGLFRVSMDFNICYVESVPV